MRTIASVGCSIFGSGTSSTRTSRFPWKVSAFIGPPPRPNRVRPSLLFALSRRHSERHVGAVPALGDPLGRAALLDEDLLRRSHHSLVAGPGGNPPPEVG